MSRRGLRHSLSRLYPRPSPIACSGWDHLVRFNQYYPRELGRDALDLPEETEAEGIQRPLLWKTVAITAGLLAAFLAGAPVAMASFLAASLLLITRRHQPHVVFAEFDWSLLVFFCGLLCQRIAGNKRRQQT